MTEETYNDTPVGFPFEEPPYSPEPPLDDESATLDALANVPVDEGEVAQGAKDSLIPAGWYTTDPENLVVKVGKAEKTGRVYARAFGKIVGPEEGRIGFGWSWKRQNKVVDGVDTGKPDGMYKNYVALVGLYEKAMEAKPEKVADVNNFIATTPIQVRVVKSSDGSDNFVVAFRLPPVPF